MKSVRVLAVCGFLSLGIVLTAAFPAELAALSKEALEASSASQMYAALRALRESYQSSARYNEFVDFLDSLSGKKKAYQPIIDYFIASARYAQLLYLEDNQQWDEYFSMGNTYRDDITSRARSARNASAADEPVSVYSLIVLWEFHNHQQDAFLEEARDDLVTGASGYASMPEVEEEPLKMAADSLARAGERGRAKQLYRLYVDKIAGRGLEAGRIKELAESFLADGNPELAQSVYDLYIDRIKQSADAAQAASELLRIAGRFVYRAHGPHDAAYAEDVFLRAEQLIGRDAFPEEMLYVRCRNLQSAGEYAAQKELLKAFLVSYPSSIHAREALYKTGMLNAYALRNRDEARKHFEAAAAGSSGRVDVYQISSLYQLGVLCQWEGRKDEAAVLYRELLGKADASVYPEVIALAKKRVQEIEQGIEMEYNLKTFLELSLLEENSRFNMTKVILSVDPQALAVNEQSSVEARPVLGPTGCFQVDVQYMWSGDLGAVSPGTHEPQFVTTFPSKGPKAVCIVINSPTGFVDRNFILVDVE